MHDERGPSGKIHYQWRELVLVELLLMLMLVIVNLELALLSLARRPQHRAGLSVCRVGAPGGCWRAQLAGPMVDRLDESGAGLRARRASVADQWHRLVLVLLDGRIEEAINHLILVRAQLKINKANRVVASGQLLAKVVALRQHTWFVAQLGPTLLVRLLRLVLVAGERLQVWLVTVEVCGLVVQVSRAHFGSGLGRSGLGLCAVWWPGSSPRVLGVLVAQLIDSVLAGTRLAEGKRD